MSVSVVFEILYKDYYVRVFGLCRRLLNSAPLAEDATQEAFMRAYRKFDNYDSNQPFWQWIASIANNHCVDLLRKRSRTAKIFGNEEEELASLQSPDKQALAALIESEDASELNRTIALLPDKYRVPLVLAYFNDSSYEQIAEHLSISTGHVGVLLLRAKQRLRSTLADVDLKESQS